VLQQHPAVKYAREIGLHLNQLALTQHYGIPTQLLDLTQDLDVAAFFATCYQTEDGNWMPAKTGWGVLYCFPPNTAYLPNANGSARKYPQELDIVGFQTFPRPGEQKAWTISLPSSLNRFLDFHRMPTPDDAPVSIFRFKHSRSGSTQFYEKFEGGNLLFPADMMANFASRIIDPKTPLSLTVVKKVFYQQANNPELLDKSLQAFRERLHDDFHIDISDRKPIQLTAEEIKAVKQEFAPRRTAFLKPVVVTGVPKDWPPPKEKT
jgi:hypothetical protein